MHIYVYLLLVFNQLRVCSLTHQTQITELIPKLIWKSQIQANFPWASKKIVSRNDRKEEAREK